MVDNTLAHIRTQALDGRLNDPDSPAWGEGGRVHNWKTHISERTRSQWATLSETVKCMIAYDAEDRADMEEWD